MIPDEPPLHGLDRNGLGVDRRMAIGIMDGERSHVGAKAIG